MTSCKRQNLNGLWSSQGETHFTLLEISDKKMAIKTISKVGFSIDVEYLDQVNLNEFTNDSLKIVIDSKSKTIDYYKFNSHLERNELTKMNTYRHDLSYKAIEEKIENKHIELWVENEKYFDADFFNHGISVSLQDTVRINPVNYYEIFQLKSQIFLIPESLYPRPIQIKSIANSSIDGSLYYTDSVISRKCKIKINSIENRTDSIYGEWRHLSDNSDKKSSITIKPNKFIFKGSEQFDTIAYKQLSNKKHVMMLPYSNGYKSTINKLEINDKGILEFTLYIGNHPKKIYKYKRMNNGM